MNDVNTTQSSYIDTNVDAPDQTQFVSIVNGFLNSNAITRATQTDIRNNNAHLSDNNSMTYTTLIPVTNYESSQMHNQMMNSDENADSNTIELRNLLKSWNLGHCIQFFQRTYINTLY